MSAGRALLACALLAACAGGPAPTSPAPPEPFPNQPGALSAEELKPVTELVKARAGGVAPLTLSASGRRGAGHPMAAYAVFAGEATRPAPNVTARRRIVCNYWANDRTWRCGSLVHYYEIDAGGRRHHFYYFAMGVPEASPRTLAELAEYALSACFAEQMKALAGGKEVPAMSTIEDVSEDASGLTMRTHMTTEPNSYLVHKLEPARDGCRFRLQTARLGRTGAVFGEPARK